LVLRANKGKAGKIALAGVAASIMWQLTGLLFAVAPSLLLWLGHQLSDAAACPYG
jgi:hypothetical protein